VGDAVDRAPDSFARRPQSRPVTAGGGQTPGMSMVRDYLSLLQLRVVLLLDATAVGVMFPAAHGNPKVTSVVAVLLGGTLAAGGAHAINCWFDRDIDGEMYRTRRRPLPNGRIPAWHALAIGIALNILAFGVLWVGAHLLAASLALARADRKSTRLNSSHQIISYAVFCLKKKNKTGLHPYYYQKKHSM